jgi:formamidopyrimidine-DNA glycosylase
MPEGHTIHRLARDQRRDLAGHPVSVSSPQGRFAESAAQLDGRSIVGVDAFGKHLFQRWDDGRVLHVHLGLIGKFIRRTTPPPPPVGAVRVRIEGPDATWDLSGPAICALVGPDEVDRVTSQLGPDPLRRNADPSRFVTRVRKSAKPIGALLLDQGVVAGIGNVFRAEVLFLHGIHPDTPGRSLSEEQVNALWDELVLQLRAGVRRNRIVTLRPDVLGRSLARISKADGLYVYHHESCRRCGGPIEALTIANRRIDACPRCQPRPPNAL